MRGSMVDIQSSTAEIRRRKKDRRKIETTEQKYRAAINTTLERPIMHSEVDCGSGDLVLYVVQFARGQHIPLYYSEIARTFYFFCSISKCYC